MHSCSYSSRFIVAVICLTVTILVIQINRTHLDGLLGKQWTEGGLGVGNSTLGVRQSYCLTTTTNRLTTETV
jgi:hypothetical protein